MTTVRPPRKAAKGHRRAPEERLLASAVATVARQTVYDWYAELAGMPGHLLTNWHPLCEEMGFLARMAADEASARLLAELDAEWRANRDAAT